MTFWALAIGAATLACMWLLGRINSYGDRMKNGETRSGLGELLLILALVAILSAIALPAYQDYTARPAAESSIQLALASARTDVAQAQSRVSSPATIDRLKRSSALISRASDIAASAAYAPLSDQQIAEILATLESASAEMDKAAAVDPHLRELDIYKDFHTHVGAAERRLTDPLQKIEVLGSRTRPTYFLPIIFILSGAFITSVLVIVGMVAKRHSGGKPAEARSWMRVYLEPIVALFAVAFGLFLAVCSEEPLSLWGSGIAGSGIGFWLRSK